MRHNNRARQARLKEIEERFASHRLSATEAMLLDLERDTMLSLVHEVAAALVAQAEARGVI